MKTPEYIPGQAYKHGYEARMEGKEMPPTEQIGLYWDEYRSGWFDAHRVIIENARRDYKDHVNKTLDENSEKRREFLQD
jgi:hypothetical protein